MYPRYRLFEFEGRTPAFQVRCAAAKFGRLFKKLQDEIWEFRTLYNKTYYRLFAFWDKDDKENTIVISTNGLIKKTDKIPKGEIEKAERLRTQYFNEKIKNNENI